jgi:hypothetical protein
MQNAQTKNADKNAAITGARKADLSEYFRKSGYTLERHGAEFYVKEQPGLCINPQKGTWYSHYNGKGGYNSIDCLTEVLGRDFKTAVAELTGTDLSVQRQNIQTAAQNANLLPSTELKMPDRNENMRRVFAYLCQTRKIPAEIVGEFAKKGLLYQSTGEAKTNFQGVEQTFKIANAVFIHRDENGQEIGGEIQGLNTNKRYKGIAEGTGESVFSFRPDGKTDTPKKVYVFESAIDLMSFYTFSKQADENCAKNKLADTALISMAGLKPAVILRMQAQGIEILSCVDNDEKGRKFENDNCFKRAGNLLEKEHVKDWNDLLVKRANGDVPPKLNPLETEKKPLLNTVTKKRM